MKNQLIEGKDYYIENGFYVFTEYYLKNRGYCCKNKCRHCPYPKEKKEKKEKKSLLQRFLGK